MPSQHAWPGSQGPRPTPQPAWTGMQGGVVPSPKALSPSPTTGACRTLSVPTLSSLPSLPSTGGFQCAWEDTCLHHPAHRPRGLPDRFGTSVSCSPSQGLSRAGPGAQAQLDLVLPGGGVSVSRGVTGGQCWHRDRHRHPGRKRRPHLHLEQGLAEKKGGQEELVAWPSPW